ncbi:MAG: lysostaphin resistance A-like protein [Puniceicoccaceae bacterium]
MGLRREPGFILFGEGIEHYSWRGAKWFLLTYFGAFLAAAVLAPVIYFWIQGMQTPADPEALVAYLQSKPISKYVDRVRLLFAAIALVWLIRACGMWGRFGYYWGGSGLKSLAGYFLVGVGSLFSVVLLQSFFMDPVLKEPFAYRRALEVVLAALAGGLVIGWLEEAIFRGMVLRMFYTAVKPLPAILLSAAIFAAVHFKSVPREIGMPFEWYSGFLVAGYQSVSVFLTVELVDFLNLFLAGVVLNLVFLRTGSLVGCMGLHAGWVLVRNTWTKLVEVNDTASTQIWGSQRIVDGYASLIILAVIAIVLYVELGKHQKRGQVGLGNLS